MATAQLFPHTRSVFRRLVSAGDVLSLLLGQASQNLLSSLLYLVQGRLTWRHYAEQAAFVGVDALGISLLMTLFSGMVIALQVAQELTKQGAGQLVGGLVALAILRELAPIMTGFAVIAMVGSAYAAELATMKIQKQVDALTVLHVDARRYLVMPRVAAAITMLPMMTLLTAMAGIIGGMVISYFVAGLNINQYMESVWQQTEPRDLIGALLKAGVFGGLIALFSTTIGLSASGGSREVGQVTTRAVVWSFIAMSVADYILSYLLFNSQGS